MESSPQHVAIIGDDVCNDLGGGAKELGLHRFLGKHTCNFFFMQKSHLYLVQTGKYRKDDSNASEGINVFKSVVEAIDHIIEQYEKRQ